MKTSVIALALWATAGLTWAGQADHHAGHGEKSAHASHDMSAMESHGQMTAVGMSANGAQENYVVKVILDDDMTISFEQPLMIKQGDIVKFVVENRGSKKHEFSIGSIAEQQAHREMMAQMPDMEHHGDGAITLQGGESGELTWHFMGESFVEFACNVGSHAQMGMKTNTVLQ